MKINVHGVHTNLTGAIEEYTKKRLSSLSKFIKNDSTLCEVELIKESSHHRSGDIYKAEANINVGKEKIFAVAEKEDLYQAVDELRDELERILSTHKDRRITLFRRGATRVKNMMKNIPSFKNPFRKKL